MKIPQVYSSQTITGLNVDTWYVENGGVAVALAFVDDELPRIVYWGESLETPEVVAQAYEALRPQRVSGSLDDVPFPTILPTQSESWIGAPRFVVERDGRELFCKLSVTDVTADVNGRVSHEISDLAWELAGLAPEEMDQAQAQSTTYPLNVPTVPRIVVTAVDEVQGVEIHWEMQILDGGLVRQRVTVYNSRSGYEVYGDNSVLSVRKLELGFPVPAAAREILTTTGHHLRERHPQRSELTIGRYEKNSMAGRPDFDASLLMSLGTPGFDAVHGEVYSVHVGWSGNSVLAVDQIPYALPVLGGGELLFGSEAVLHAKSDAENYTSPWVYGSFGHGLNEVAQRFHQYVLSMHPQFAHKPRPVILNTWEAVYFEHSHETLVKLADTAALCGVERFVVDDGWFGSRRDDTSGLGDWQISPEVWPQGLKPLADHVHGLGMEFGLWFEPEMVNPDSDVAREHPEWILAPHSGRLPMQGRSQQVLDLTNPEALRYVFDCMDELVDSVGIDYIKWDHNKLVTEPASAESGYAPTQRKQVEAVYAIFDALKIKHDGLEIESCSSGGGRVDLGILARADRIWTSDCVDPVERADIQRYTSLLVPEMMMGEHVGASPAHSTHRPTSLSMRAATALFGHFGIEWDLNEQSQEELDALARWVELHKCIRSWSWDARVVHGEQADPSARVDGLVARDGHRAVYRFTQLTSSAHYPAQPVRLPGLDPHGVYRIKPAMVQNTLTVEESNAQSELLWWTAEGVEVSGALLTSYGVRPPQLNPAQACVFTLDKVVKE